MFGASSYTTQVLARNRSPNKTQEEQLQFLVPIPTPQRRAVAI